MPHQLNPQELGPVGKEGIIIGGKKHNKTYRKKRHGNKSLTAWVKFVKKVAREEKLPYRDAMMRAKVRKDKGEKWMSGGNEIDDGDDGDAGAATTANGDAGAATTANGDAGAATTANGANGATANGELSIIEGGRRRRSRRNKSKRRGSKRSSRRGTKKRR